MIRAAAVTLVLAAAFVASCLRWRESVGLQPDGSGSISFEVAVRLDPALGAPDAKSADAFTARAKKAVVGAAAFTDVAQEMRGEWVTTRFTAWFDDVNSLSVHPADDPTRMRWTREGDGWTFELTPGAITGLARLQIEDLDAAERAPPAQRAAARKEVEASVKLFAGLDLRTEIRLPGVITAVEGFERKDDRTVAVRLTAADLADADRMRALAAARFRARCGPSVMTAAEEEAFRAAFERAKAGASSAPRAETPRSPEPPADALRTALVRTVTSSPRKHARVLLSDGRLVSFDHGLHVSLPDGRSYGQGTGGREGRGLAVSSDLRRAHMLDDEGGLVTYELSPLAYGWKRAPEPDAPAGARGWSVVALRDGVLLLVLGERRAALHRGYTGELVAEISGPWSTEHAPVASLEADRVLVRFQDKVVAVDTSARRRPWTFQARSRGAAAKVVGLGIGRDSGPAAVVVANKAGSELVVLDPANGKERCRVDVPPGEVSVSPTGRRAVVDSDLPVVVDLAEGRTLGRLPTPYGEPITFGADDLTLVYPPAPAPRPGREDRWEIRIVRLELARDDAAPPAKK